MENLLIHIMTLYQWGRPEALKIICLMFFMNGKETANEKGGRIENHKNAQIPRLEAILNSFLIIARMILFVFPFWPPTHNLQLQASCGMTRAIPKHLPNDYVSASSTSTPSYAASISSSTFTLSSRTDGSSASSALFEGCGRQGQGNGTDDLGNSVFSI